MDKLITLVTNRRGWVLLVPVVAAIGGAFGLDEIVLTDLLTDFGDKITMAIMAGFSLRSLFGPKGNA